MEKYYTNVRIEGGKSEINEILSLMAKIQYLGNSGATVKVFKSMGLVKTFNAGSDLSNRWWQVFCFDSTSNIIDIGKPGCELSSFFNSPSN